MAIDNPKNQKENPVRLVIEASGPRVGKASISAIDAAAIIEFTQRALRRIGETISGTNPKHAGRPSRDIGDSCELFIVGIQEGSISLVMEVGRESEEQESLIAQHLGARSLELLTSGMDKIEKGKPLPEGFDKSVVGSFKQLGDKVLDRGIDVLNFYTENGTKAPKKAFEYDHQLHSRLTAVLAPEPRVKAIRLFGRLEGVDVHVIPPHGTLYDETEKAWKCIFLPEDTPRVKEALLRYVQLEGKLDIREKERERIVSVTHFEIVESTKLIEKSPKLLAEIKDARESLSSGNFLTRKDIFGE